MLREISGREKKKSDEKDGEEGGVRDDEKMMK